MKISNYTKSTVNDLKYLELQIKESIKEKSLATNLDFFENNEKQISQDMANWSSVFNTLCKNKK